ncbi:aromatic acid exporter family protein [Texcoconibacillus texcoconensis]|uniref:Uncharacterized membrane protein YgaE (UPF0421/DUF939 family) n=1 Tax=Texcoconibacillus texcoconensis TaxID=1095777 RepID=A0A840QNS2_9BACI|nr:aromatic acid exporter family protein [Texcoconibacillus texcoconensis]MBB5173032.1 uncharacterized membrane protein YgaE (UPF0421/DUF939 family) [Texcoconibacillus texcoconensis]
MFRIGYRTLKTAIGTAIAIAIAQQLGLEFYSSAGIITILCIQKTRQRSLQMSWERLLAASIGMLYAGVLFEVLGYNPAVMGLLLLVFIPTTLVLKAQAGIVTSSVIILHIYALEAISVSIVLNEFALMLIGISCALLMNAYMPSVDKKLHVMQHQLESYYKQIFHEFATYVRNGDSDWDGKEIAESAKLLEQAKSTSLQNIENHVLPYEDQYYHYFKMREKQFDIIERVMPLLTSIDRHVDQGEMIADFLEELSENIKRQNTADYFLQQLEEMQGAFKRMELPTSREEFETRSALLYFVKEMEEYLTIKSRFKPIEKYSMFS